MYMWKNGLNRWKYWKVCGFKIRSNTLYCGEAREIVSSKRRFFELEKSYRKSYNIR